MARDEASTGIIGTPLVDASARFLCPASYGDAIDVESSIIIVVLDKSFVMKHTIRPATKSWSTEGRFACSRAAIRMTQANTGRSGPCKYSRALQTYRWPRGTRKPEFLMH